MATQAVWATCECGAVGDLTLVSLDGERLSEARFPEGRDATRALPTGAAFDPSAGVLRATAAWLADYAAGGRPDPLELPLDPHGTTYQRLVWECLLEIPYGEVVSYGQLAARVGEVAGRRTSARAVGGAVGRNPIGIVVPCHRVVGSDGSMTGFGGGMAAKRALLGLEGLDPSRPVVPGCRPAWKTRPR